MVGERRTVISERLSVLVYDAKVDDTRRRGVLMKKYYRTILLGVFLIFLFLISLKISGKIFPSGSDSIWFHSGLLMVILGMYWVEHYFTKPQDVFSNGLIGFRNVSMI